MWGPYLGTLNPSLSKTLRPDSALAWPPGQVVLTCPRHTVCSVRGLWPGFGVPSVGYVNSRKGPMWGCSDREEEVGREPGPERFEVGAGRRLLPQSPSTIGQRERSVPGPWPLSRCPGPAGHGDPPSPRADRALPEREERPDLPRARAAARDPRAHAAGLRGAAAQPQRRARPPPGAEVRHAGGGLCAGE